MIKINDLDMRYDDRYILKDINLQLETERCYIIIGESGVGKSTFLNVLCGLLKPTRGKVIIEGQDTYALNHKCRNKFRKCNISYITQDINVINSITVLENVCLPAYVLNGEVTKEVVSVALKYMKMLGIEQYANVQPCFLSGGEVRRVEIARALTSNRPYVIADEPTSSLDKENTERVIDALHFYMKKGGTVVVSTHDHSFLKMADKTFCIEATEIKEIKNEVILLGR